ncbi:substrate-binding domain-containing protein [Schlesneria paludicola]|uniref:substrate-binding domain-containing protein n=1 Tax=Schlesneria paludicola TaxID=360056 RepID=UPI0012F7D0AA|nr:substrate-binding domain-containing protein [Schlesneria paludicola]
MSLLDRRAAPPVSWPVLILRVRFRMKANTMLIKGRLFPCSFLFALVVCLGCEPSIPKGTSKPGADASAPAGDAGTSAGNSSLKRLIILSNTDSPFWDACREGVLATNSELKLKESGLIAVLDVNDGTAQGQLSKLQQYGTQSDIAGIGISALDAENVAIADELRAIQKKGIKILTIDSDVKRESFRDARHAFVGTDNAGAGRVLGICAKALRPEGGEYVAFVGRSGAQNAIDRIGGFGEGAGEKFHFKDTMTDDTDKTKARDNVRNAMRNHPNLNVLVGIWSYNAPAIVDIVKETNRRKDFSVVVFDAEPTAITAMADGNIDVMVVQNPFQMGYQGIRALAALVTDNKAVLTEMYPKFGQPDGDVYDTGLKVVVPNTDSPIKGDLFEKGVEFITLDKLQEWMKKYGLTGS